MSKQTSLEILTCDWPRFSISNLQEVGPELDHPIIHPALPPHPCTTLPPTNGSIQGRIGVINLHHQCTTPHIPIYKAAVVRGGEGATSAVRVAAAAQSLSRRCVSVFVGGYDWRGCFHAMHRSGGGLCAHFTFHMFWIT
jgi:hypothetical protein